MSTVPWWGWLIIGVIALLVVFFVVMFTLVMHAHRAAMREINSINLGPLRRAASRHFTDEPYTRKDASGHGPWPFV